MAFVKRIFLFLAVNLVVILTISFVLNILGVKPYLQAQGLNYTSLLLFCFIWGMAGAFISLGLSKMMAKWLMGVRIVDAKDPEYASLVEMIHRLASEANLPAMPEVGVYESREVNAFATGPSKRRSLVAVSSGLLQRMNEKELEGVLAHEISHIANGDMVTMTLIQGVVNAFVMFLARVLAYVFSGFGKKSESSSGGSYASYIIFMYLFEFVFMILGSLIVAWFSRKREFRADRGGAYLAGKEKMIGALEALKKTVKRRDPHTEKPYFPGA